MANQMMKLVSLVLLLGCMLMLAVAGLAAPQVGAAHPVEGTYSVEAKGNDLGTITFLMTLKREGDKWIGEVKDSPVPLSVKSVTVDADNKVTILADTGGTQVTITGKFEANMLAGNWTAGDATGSWSGTKKEMVTTTEKIAAPVSAVSTASLAALEGAYDAQVTADGQGTLPFVLIIKRDGDKLITEVKDAGDLNIVGIKVDGEAVTLSATFQGNPFELPGKISSSEMSGKWEAGGFAGTWSAKKRTDK